MSEKEKTVLAFEITSGRLLEGLKQVAGVIENAQVMQILSCVKITLYPGKLVLLASDSDIQISAVVEDEQLSVDGAMSVAVPGKKLLEICRSLPADERIQFAQYGHWLEVKARRTQFKLATMNYQDFPEYVVDSGQRFSIPAKDLIPALSQTVFAMAIHDVRQFLNGLLIDVTTDTIRFVATDSHRLGMYQIASTAHESIRLILPRKATLELQKLMRYGSEDVNFICTDKMVSFESGSFILSSSLIAGAYPDYNRLIPKGELAKCALSTDALKSALSRAAILSQDRFKSVRLKFANKELTLFADNSHNEQVQESVPVFDLNHEGQIAFNLNYLLDVLNVIDAENVEINFGESKQAVLIRSDSSSPALFIIMPLTL